MSIPSPARPPAVALSAAFWYWLKLGCVSFGGPAGQIAMMHAELVERRRWISEQRFLHALNYCMLLPGPEATQLAIYIGWLLHKTRGGILAGVLFVLPSLLVLIALSWIYMAFGTLPVVTAVLYGIKPAIVAIVLAAAWRIGARTLRHAALVAIAAAAFVAIGLLGLPFPLVVLGAAAIGAVGARVRPAWFQGGAARAGSPAAHRQALIDDTTPTPAHAHLSWARVARVALAGCALGALALAMLAWLAGPRSVFTQMGWFFTKAALLGFGGAYAVLPYVVQGGVEHYHWLGMAQMIDGLALGETTPGPLIMVNAFVGFAALWNHPTGAGPAASAIGGACVATFFTFLPSFVFILAGGPLVESTRDDLRMTAPLTAISAAVVGVIASLALFFGQHVFLRAGQPDPAALAIGAAALLALLRFRAGTIGLIAACAAAGLVLS